MEEQLSCSICTEILYQPVQLHECEHYFCGWCLKEWLQHNPICPTCRSPPTRVGRSRTLDNLLEAFLLNRQDLAPSAERRAEAASYTPGEDLGLLLRNPDESRNLAGSPSSLLQEFPLFQIPQQTIDSISSRLALLGHQTSQTTPVRPVASRALPGEDSWGPLSQRPAFPGTGDLEEEVEEIPHLPNGRMRRDVAPSYSRPVISEPRSFTPYSGSNHLFSTPASSNTHGQFSNHSYYSPQPIAVNNYNVHNHYYNQTSSPYSSLPTTQGSNVIVNGVVLDAFALMSLAAVGVNTTPGSSYWYDSKCGLWGYQGGPSSGIIQAGLSVGGPLRVDASGTPFTRIYANGRELPLQDLASLRNARIYPVAGQRLWINMDGTCGVEGSPYVWGNVFLGNSFNRGAQLGALIGGLFFGRLFR